jgi:hypothetical protein
MKMNPERMARVANLANGLARAYVLLGRTCVEMAMPTRELVAQLARPIQQRDVPKEVILERGHPPITDGNDI